MGRAEPSANRIKYPPYYVKDFHGVGIGPLSKMLAVKETVSRLFPLKLRISRLFFSIKASPYSDISLVHVIFSPTRHEILLSYTFILHYSCNFWVSKYQIISL